MRHVIPPHPALRWTDVVPWVLAAVAVVLLIQGAFGMWSEDQCFEQVAAEGSGWTNHPVSLWPPGSSCTVTFPDGREVFVESRTWAPVVGAALAAGVLIGGYARPPTQWWRWAAQVMTVPAVIAFLGALALAGPDGSLNVVGAFGAIGLVLAVPVAVTVAALRFSGASGSFARTFFAVWPFGAVVALGLLLTA